MITSLRLQNFRSYKDESFEFEPGVNIVVGPNASGKTNLLEAVYILAAGSSYRAKDSELVNLAKKWARVDAVFGKQARILKLTRETEFTNKQISIDGKLYQRLSFERTVPIVFFEPNQMQLTSRGPEHRREYIDMLLQRSTAGFKALSNSYRRALAQRNALLKKPYSSGKSQLFAWDVRLSEIGGKIAQKRSELIEGINKEISKSYSQIAKRKSSVKLEYLSQFQVTNYASRMVSKLGANTRLDYERGFTSSGPHREDIIFFLNKQPVNPTASRGETRSLLLSLKLFELRLVEEARGQKPIFLLDDVFSELDGARRRHLVKALEDYQTILTTTDADAVMEYFASDNQKIIPL